MDFTKFIDLLESNALYFPRIDRLTDPWEGTIAGLTHRSVLEKRPNVQQDKKLVDDYLYVNCWHSNEYESVGMWMSYLRSSDGVSVVTDYESLVSSVESTRHVLHSTMVTYIDYEAEEFPVDSPFRAVAHKRRIFMYEHELRLLYWGLEIANQGLTRPNAAGVRIPVDLKRLVKAIYVAPMSAGWLLELIKKIIVRYGLDVPVVASTVNDHPGV